LHISEKNSTFVHFFGKMESNNDIKQSPSPRQHAMLFGLELGIFFGLRFIIGVNSMDNSWMSLLQFLMTLYIIYGIIRSTLHYRMTDCGGEITFGQSFRYIYWLFFYSAIVATLVRVVYLKWFDTTYFALLYEQAQKAIETLDFKSYPVSQDEILANMSRMLTPVRFSAYIFVSDLITGVFAGLILSPFIKRIKVKIE